mmetsp:Transcript_17880/g.57829  ORF Transcript_17880/g.57829 Transcript_17880/m.57829 type:complete len:389 (-) Transcript_17880:670-1836(-)
MPTADGTGAARRRRPTHGHGRRRWTRGPSPRGRRRRLRTREPPRGGAPAAAADGPGEARRTRERHRRSLLDPAGLDGPVGGKPLRAVALVLRLVPPLPARRQRRRGLVGRPTSRRRAAGGLDLRPRAGRGHPALALGRGRPGDGGPRRRFRSHDRGSSQPPHPNDVPGTFPQAGPLARVACLPAEPADPATCRSLPDGDRCPQAQRLGRRDRRPGSRIRRLAERVALAVFEPGLPFAGRGLPAGVQRSEAQVGAATAVDAGRHRPRHGRRTGVATHARVGDAGVLYVRRAFLRPLPPAMGRRLVRGPPVGPPVLPRQAKDRPALRRPVDRHRRQRLLRRRVRWVLGGLGAPQGPAPPRPRRRPGPSLLQGQRPPRRASPRGPLLPGGP